MNLKPLADNVVVKVLEEETTTASGIVLPENAEKKKKKEAEVVAVGPGRVLDNGQRGAMDIAVGQKVLCKSWAGDEIELNDVEYKVMSMENILAIIE
ncbi:MAG: co-chaperone GroES [Nitrospinae bacterium CG11_big_fil_rev_8_21_14_0_20_56_8]|nr:MAG: co-chaperone GroES [Nitrospinae bacterium CG11_big_fil_rev_8_21_14_0_20_56_8]